MLAGSDFDAVFAKGGANGRVAKDVVGGGGFFDEEGFERCEMGEVGFGFRDGPDLMNDEVERGQTDRLRWGTDG